MEELFTENPRWHWKKENHVLPRKWLLEFTILILLELSVGVKYGIVILVSFLHLKTEGLLSTLLFSSTLSHKTMIIREYFSPCCIHVLIYKNTTSNGYNDLRICFKLENTFQSRVMPSLRYTLIWSCIKLSWKSSWKKV